MEKVKLDYDSLAVRIVEWKRTNTVSVLSCIRGFNSLFSVSQKCVLTTKLKSVWAKASACILYCWRWNVSNSARVFFPQKAHSLATRCLLCRITEQILLGHLENKKVIDDSQCDFTKANLTNLVAFYEEHLPVTKGTKGRLTTRKLERDYLQRPVVIRPGGMT